MLLIFPSSAFAQFGPPGGYVPYTVDAPAAAAAASARTNNGLDEQTRPHCHLVTQGRGGDRTECDDGSASPPRR